MTEEQKSAMVATQERKQDQALEATSEPAIQIAQANAAPEPAPNVGSIPNDMRPVSFEPLTEKQLDSMIANLRGQKITQEAVEARIGGKYFLTLPESTTTLCIMRMLNGFTIVGKSACIDPANFNEEIGRQLAYKEALGYAWDFEAYLAVERNLVVAQLEAQQKLNQAAENVH